MMPDSYEPCYGIKIDLLWLAYDLADDLLHEDLIKFILRMDLRKADMDFTEKLYAAIGDELRKELEVDDQNIPDHLYHESCPGTCCGGSEDLQ